MALTIDIINGVTTSVEQIATQKKLEESERKNIVKALKEMSSSIYECIEVYRGSKQIPHAGLAQFLNHSKAIKRLLGEGLDKNTTNTLRNVLLNAQMFDKDLEESLKNFKPKLLNVLVFGPPIHSFFSSGRAIKKLQNATIRLDIAAEKIKSSS